MLDKMPVKVKRFEFKGEYEGWWCDVRINAPLGIFLDRMSAVQEADTSDPIKIAPKLYDLMELVVVGWNFADENGKPLPFGIEGLKQLPLDLLLAVGEAIKGETLTVPLALGSS